MCLRLHNWASYRFWKPVVFRIHPDGLKDLNTYITAYMWFSSWDTFCSLLFSRLSINSVLAMAKVCFSKGTHWVKAALTTTIADQGHEWAENCVCIYSRRTNVSKLTWSSYEKITSRIKAISCTELKNKRPHKHLSKEKSGAPHGKRTIEARGLNWKLILQCIITGDSVEI